jgi:hypothetical protein
MSILLHLPSPVKKLVAKPKHAEPKTSSILLVSFSIFIAIIILMYSGLMYTDTMMKQYSACRDKIIGYEQSGMYSSPEDFKVVLSYCDVS